MRLAVTIPFTNENKKKRYPVRTRYHRTTASGWGHVETFAHNRKETHLEKLEKLEHKIEVRMQKLEKDEKKQAKLETETVKDGAVHKRSKPKVTKEPVPA